MFVTMTFSQFEPVVGNASTEKARNLDILAKIGKRKGVLDVKKAVNVHIAEEQRRYMYIR